MEVKTAVIAAAGFGSRFLPAVKNIPKEMLAIINKPSIQYLVDECMEAGIEHIIIVVRQGNTLIKDYFSKPAPDVKELLKIQGKEDRYVEVEKILALQKYITIVEQDPSLPYGNGSPFYSVKHLLKPGEHFVFMFGDDMVIPQAGKPGSVQQIIDAYKEDEDSTDCVIAGVEFPKEIAMKWGACVRFKNFDQATKSGVMDFQVEKPTEEQYVSNKLSPIMTYGRMVMDYRIFDYLTPESTGKDGELWLQDSIAKLAVDGVVKVKILDGEFVTTGDPEKIFKTIVLYYLANQKYGPAAKEFLKSLQL